MTPTGLFEGKEHKYFITYQCFAHLIRNASLATPPLPPSPWGFNPLNAELNPIHHLLALVGARHIVHVRRVRVK